MESVNFDAHATPGIEALHRWSAIVAAKQIVEMNTAICKICLQLIRIYR